MIEIALIAAAVAFLLGMPLAFAMLTCGLIYFLGSGLPPQILAQRILGGVSSFPLLSIPFFVMAGIFMANGGIAQRIISFANMFVGHWRGGLAQVMVFNSLIMGGMSGLAAADAAIDARVLVPQMRRVGYPLGFSSALAACGGLLAPLLPPSMGMIIYGLLAQVSIGRMFVAGIVPGLLLTAGLVLTVMIMARRNGWTAARPEPASWGERAKATKEAIWALMMPVLLLVGLRMGVFTPTELGAMAAAYALFVGTVITKQIDIRNVFKDLLEVGKISGMIMLIIGAAAAFSAPIAYAQVPDHLTSAILAVSENKIVVLMMVNIVVLVLGMFIDATALMILAAPMLAPVGHAIGVDPVQFGVMMVMNISLGTIHPPVGGVMYVVCSITGCSVEAFTKALLPMLVPLLAVLLLVTYVPAVTLTLPRLVF